jgi:class 3 adenylate cyclase
MESFFGFAIIVDLRNYSEIGRRLLMQKDKPFSNNVKWQIYAVILDFLAATMDSVHHHNKGVLFDYKHTGDGFLFITRHQQDKMLDFLDSFQLLLEIYLALSKLVPELNLKIIDLLKANLKIVAGNKHLRYIKSLFKDETSKAWQPFIDFSIGAHCGTIFYRTYATKKFFLGNTINQAYRFQALSSTFSDYNLFFSEEIATVLKKVIAEPTLLKTLENQYFKSLARVEIKGLGPTSVQAIGKNNVLLVRDQLARLS